MNMGNVAEGDGVVELNINIGLYSENTMTVM